MLRAMKEMVIKIISIGEIEKYQGEILSIFPQDIIAKIKRKASKKAYLESLASSYLIHKYVGFNNLEISKTGKPLVKEGYISISHSKEYATIGFFDESLGLDIEKIKPLSLDFKQLVFSKEELELMKSIPQGEIVLWCLKESFSKCIGEGMVGDFKKIPAKVGSFKVNNISYYSNFAVYKNDYILAYTIVGEKPITLKIEEVTF